MNQHPTSGQSWPADGQPDDPRSQETTAGERGGSGGSRPVESRPVDARPGERVAAERSPAEAKPSHEPVRARRTTPAANASQQGLKDINPILQDWDFEPGTINVRKVRGADGEPKLQMRLDLGLLQMELNGRPDGRRPFGCESLLDYHETRLAEHQKQHGTDLGFSIDGRECQLLRDEAVMYYQRYLSLFVLEEFPGVVRDTARNLRLLDLCSQFAAEEDDRIALEQYRPYITMMNTRAKASILFRDKRPREALRVIDAGLEQIHDFFDRFGQVEMYEKANEVKVLKRLARDIRKKLPVSPLAKLQKRLDKAVKAEKYEEAARLRDRIAAMKGESKGPPGRA